MRRHAGRVIYYASVIALMLITTTTAFDDAMRRVLGDGIGGDQSAFWNLQVESYFVALMIPPILDFVYRIRVDRDGWTGRDPGAKLRAATYGLFVLITLAFSVERPLRSALRIVLPDDIAFSLAHYCRRGLETPITVLVFLLFLDLVLRVGRSTEAERLAST